MVEHQSEPSNISKGLRIGAKVAEFIIAAYIVVQLLTHYVVMPSPIQYGLGWFVGTVMCFRLPPSEFKLIGLKRWLLISLAIGLLAALVSTRIGD